MLRLARRQQHHASNCSRYCYGRNREWYDERPPFEFGKNVFRMVEDYTQRDKNRIKPRVISSAISDNLISARKQLPTKINATSTVKAIAHSRMICRVRRRGSTRCSSVMNNGVLPTGSITSSKTTMPI